MSVAHLSFMSISAAGHVKPTLPVVSELVARGHRVTYFTSASFGRQITEARATLRASGEDWLGSLPVPGQPDRLQLMLPMMKRVFEDLRTSFPVLVNELMEDHPA